MFSIDMSINSSKLIKKIFYDKEVKIYAESIPFFSLENNQPKLNF